MGYHENSPEEFMDRTFANLNFIDAHVNATRVYEVQQVILSFLTIVAFPREKYLKANKLKWILLDDELVTQRLRFPRMESSSEFDTERPATLDALTRLLRNAVAHGNLEILNRQTLVERRVDAPIHPDLSDNIIAGIELWNVREGRRTWGTILTESEMRSTLQAMKRLATLDEFRTHRSEPLNGGRPIPNKNDLIESNSGSRVADKAREQEQLQHRRNTR